MQRSSLYVERRRGSRNRSGQSIYWLKLKNPASGAGARERESSGVETGLWATFPPMGFSKRLMAKERAAALRAEAERLRRLQGPEIAEAEELVRRWNRRAARGGQLPWYPTIGAAILAGMPLLDFVCPGCRICGQGRKHRTGTKMVGSIPCG
jgi:hypothetical protein